MNQTFNCETCNTTVPTNPAYPNNKKCKDCYKNQKTEPFKAPSTYKPALSITPDQRARLISNLIDIVYKGNKSIDKVKEESRTLYRHALEVLTEIN